MLFGIFKNNSLDSLVGFAAAHSIDEIKENIHQLLANKQITLSEQEIESLQYMNIDNLRRANFLGNVENFKYPNGRMIVERAGIYSIEDVLSKVVYRHQLKGLKRGTPEYKAVEEVDFDGHKVHMCSNRYILFATKGITCVKCGIIGSYFALERTNEKHEKFHFNLYAETKGGQGRLMTKDHINPLVNGGADNINNLQVMCTKCNNKKGSKVENNDN